ncbi:MAG: AtzE family amidohydrolase [Janthinobacterium lividum]
MSVPPRESSEKHVSVPCPDSVAAIAAAVNGGQRRATDIVQETYERIGSRDAAYNCFTRETRERAESQARLIDQRLATGADIGSLAGVPFAVKNLFDIEGVVTLAGARLREHDAAATRDACLVSRLTQQGAILTGALNMDEHAYGFTTENTHYGVTRNPRDVSRIAGGSSGGSAAAVAGGLVPLSLGSDTNGSIRVPASLCGVFGLKPTFGRLPRTGSFPFVGSLDHLGPFAGNVLDLAMAYDALQGPDPTDAACAQRRVEPVCATLEQWQPGKMRVGLLGGYFDEWAGPAARAAARAAAAAFGDVTRVILPDVEKARAAAFVITAAEGGALHRQRLHTDYDAYEPLSRDRLVAGSLVPAAWLIQAQRVRHRFYQNVRDIFSQYDVLVAPATPVCAPVIGAPWLTFDQRPGERYPVRATLGILTQPLSCIGLPVAVVPTWLGMGDEAHLPLGVQLIAPHWREDLCLRAARYLETTGLADARLA